MSAISITAITPASTGSLTTTSAASGTEPAMFVHRTMIPASLISRTAVLMSPPISAPASTSDRPHRLGQLLLPHQRNRVDRDALASDVVPVRLGDRALRHHPYLRAAADDDHPLAVDALKRGHSTDLGNALEADQVRDQLRLVAGAADLELQLGGILAMGAAGDVGDVRAVLEDRLRDAVEHTGLVARRDQEPEDHGVRHA